ncbi:MAG: hypothetical protein OXU25_05145 [Thaumarchaeota archaeon]|nr:hypothetical protein [Nitrososphaerota archaeon]
MDHYSHADRTSLVRAVRRLLEHCDCYGRSAIQEIGGHGMPVGHSMRMAHGTKRIRLNDGTTYCAFEPGARIEVSPTGQARHYRDPPESMFGGGATPPDISPKVDVRIPGMERADPDPTGAWRAGSPPMAPLPAAFRVCRLLEGRQDVQFAVPTKEPGGMGTETVPVGRVRAGTWKTPRAAFVGTLPSYPEDLERAVACYEDSMCLERLEGLDMVDEKYTCRHDSTLGELARFVAGLNATRPRELCLDRVLVNYGMFWTLFGNDGRTPGWAAGYPFYDGSLLYGNMSVLGGIAFLEHPKIRHGSAFALSSRQGPVFVHGQSYVRCTEDALEANRECKVVDPPEGAARCPWGVRFGVDIGYDLEETRFIYGD